MKRILSIIVSLLVLSAVFPARAASGEGSGFSEPIPPLSEGYSPAEEVMPVRSAQSPAPSAL